jgi:hypothetical protein
VSVGCQAREMDWKEEERKEMEEKVATHVWTFNELEKGEVLGLFARKGIETIFERSVFQTGTSTGEAKRDVTHRDEPSLDRPLALLLQRGVEPSDRKNDDGLGSGVDAQL